MKEIEHGVLFYQDSRTYIIEPGPFGGSIQRQKEKMIIAVSHAFDCASQDMFNTTVEYRNRTKNGNRVVEVVLNGSHTTDGYSLVKNQHTGYWQLIKENSTGIPPKISNEFTNIKDAKLFTDAYLKGESEPAGVVIFQGINCYYKIYNSRYHLKNFYNAVAKSKGVKY